MSKLNKPEKEDLLIKDIFDTSENDFVFQKDTHPLTIRENKDYEIFFFFNPSKYSVDISRIREIMARASLRTGISGCELKNIEFGEISIHFNPITTDQKDRNFVKSLIEAYFDELATSQI